MENKYEVSALILRVILGVSFFLHGLAKFQGGLVNTAGWFDSIGIPSFLAYVVAFIELVGGIAMVVGFGTRIAAGLFVIIMFGAIFTVKISAGFMGNGQMSGFELDLAFLGMALSLAISGSKAYALDHLLFKGKEAQQTTAVK